MLGFGLMAAESEVHRDVGMLQLLPCPVCGHVTFAGGGRRSDAVYCSSRAGQVPGVTVRPTVVDAVS